MKHITCLGLIIGLLTGTTGFGAPFNDGFKKASGAQYVENIREVRNDVGFEERPGMTGVTCLRLRNENQKDILFKMIPVTPGEEVEISFRAQFIADETGEDNPLIAETVRRGHRIYYKHVPFFEHTFYDKQEKKGKVVTSGMPFREWREYRRKFIVPPNVRAVQFAFNSGINDGVLYVDNLKFNQRKMSKQTITLEFDNLPHDLSGLMSPNSGAGVVVEQGASYVNTGYGSTTDRMMVNGGKTYQIKFEGKAYGNNVKSTVRFFRGTKKVGDAKLDSPLVGNTVAIPKNADSLEILIYNHLLQRITLNQK